LSKIYHEIGKSDLAFRHLSQANDITNELYNQEKYAMANQIAVKYKTMEKEQVIRELEEKNELSAFKLTQRTRFFIILCFFLAMGAFAAFNYYRLQKHRYDSEKLLNTQKEEIAKQKINDLENSLRIKNLQAVVRGQEAERTRIATDLHDSLGGMLSTLKLQYDSLQVDHEALIDDKDYHKIMGLIDDACRDVRDIARNLKPNALEKLGLTAALRDLVNRYRIKDTLDIHVNTNQVDGLLDEESSLHVYRIIQELLNNALKHAQATDIDVQIINVADELVIMVQDNGKGFDQSSIQKGLGLDNLASRVNVLQGEMEIDSSLARGTSVTVHIPLAKSEAIQNAELVTA
ncbi:MAG: sensor histidine kinase, partial [Bacteroidota bacterium]